MTFGAMMILWSAISRATAAWSPSFARRVFPILRIGPASSVHPFVCMLFRSYSGPACLKLVITLVTGGELVVVVYTYSQ
ncbi:hypothetical protein SCA6_015565 [Theobroma cacao]